MNGFVSNMKFHLRKTLCLQGENKQHQQNQKKANSKTGFGQNIKFGTGQHKSKLPYQNTEYSGNQKLNCPPQMPFMYPMFPGFNPGIMSYMSNFPPLKGH